MQREAQVQYSIGCWFSKINFFSHIPASHRKFDAGFAREKVVNIVPIAANFISQSNQTISELILPSRLESS